MLKNRSLKTTEEKIPAAAVPVDFASLRVGTKKLEDAIFNFGTYQRANPRFADKSFIMQALERVDAKTAREISDYYYNSSGIYRRACEYLAFLYKYDWMVTPFKISDKEEPKLLKDFTKVLTYLDESYIKNLFGRISLITVRRGVFYGYICDFGDKFTIQQLPDKYCRSRYYSGVEPVIELNMAFFDDTFKDIEQRLKAIKVFPKEIQHGYILYKQGKLTGDTKADKGWFTLDPKYTVRFSINSGEFPPLIASIPSLLDLDAAQDLDRKKMMQQLLKILIQKLPLDKNGDLIFDIDEAKDIHNNTVGMVKRAVGVDVITTFADIEVADMRDKNSATTADELQKVERTVYNNLGISQNLFNSEGNVAQEKSILNDEAVMRGLLSQFNALLNRIVSKFNKKSHYVFKVDVLETTIYNYKEMSKLYKEQTQIGFSKLLPQIALGHSQSSLIATATFENTILKLNEIMIPPLMSSTMSSKNLVTAGSDNKGGRPTNEDSGKEVADKTIANRESQS